MDNTRPIYLDDHSTTPCDPEVVRVIVPLLGDMFGNASSRQHLYGLQAADFVKNARQQLASFINADPEEIIFTSGATESVNLAIKGVAEMYAFKGKHIITARSEHSSVLDCCESLQKKGYEITYLEPGAEGIISADQLESAIRKDTILIALMWANNETGVIQDMDSLVQIARGRDVIFFSDATQALGKLKINAQTAGAGLLSFSAHKIYGPKGVGALYIRRKDPRVKLVAQMDGGGQERGLRSGTLNVPGIAGFGEAIKRYRAIQQEENRRIGLLRNRLENALLEEDEVFINGSQRKRLVTVTNLCFRFTDGKKLLAEINQELAVSSGAACSSASTEPSHVLLGMGLGKSAAEASIRFSLGRFTTVEEITRSIEIVKNALKKVRTEQYPDYKSLLNAGSDQPDWFHPAALISPGEVTGIADKQDKS